MKKRLAFVGFVVLAAVFMTAFVVHAADVTLRWNAADGATGYILEMSTDNGTTWTNQTDVGNVTTYVWAGVPDTGMIFFRAVSYNASAQSTRYEAGAWYNGDWKPPGEPGGVGIE